MDNIGKQLYIIRKKKGFTLRELEEMSGVKFVRIGRFENNMERPSPEIIEKLEKALDIKFADVEKVSKEIKEIYNRFVDSLFYDLNDLESYEKNIKDNEGLYIVNVNYSIILLMQYVINILQNHLENLEEYEKELERLLDEKSDYLQLYYGYKGLKLFIKEKYEESEDVLQRALTVSNNRKQNIMICYHLSTVCKRRRKFIEALKYADIAKNGFVEYASFKRILYIDGQTGSIYSQMGRLDLAIEKYMSCLNTFNVMKMPMTIKALILRNLSWIYIKSGNYVKPLEYLEEAEKLEPDSNHLKMYKIWCNYKLGKYNTARSLIEEYSDLRTVKSHKKRYKLFSELVYSAGKKPTITLIELAIDTYNEFAAKHDYELMNFYIDIVIDLLKQRNDDKTLIQYLELKIKINDEINK